MSRAMRITLAVLLLATTSAWADKKPAPAPLRQPPIAAGAAARIPDAGRLVSYRTDAELAIARITKTGPKELWRTPADWSAHAAWIDGKTLVLVALDEDKNIEVKWIVDGVVDAKRTIKHKAAIWALKDDEMPNVEGALRGADGGIWLQRCVKEDPPDCAKSSWLRVDLATPKLSRTKPGKLTSFGDSVKAPAIKPPAGYSGKIVKIKSTVEPKRKIAAIECVGPKGKMVWSQESPPIDPAERFTPKKVRWIHATPPLLEVRGVHVNPVSQEADVEYVFRDCAAAPYDDVAWIGDGMWSYMERDSENIHVHVDDMPVAVFAGSNLRAAPAK
jgi:hypothetical protein